MRVLRQLVGLIRRWVRELFGTSPSAPAGTRGFEDFFGS
jgi:hypothetical protein